MLDYGAWVRRLQAFVEGRRAAAAPADREQFQIEIAPPLDRAGLKDLEATSSVRLPRPLRAFLTKGTSSVAFRWAGPQYEGEEVFCPAEELIEWRQEAAEYAQCSWPSELEWPLDYAYWRHGWPLTQDPAGNGLALWVHAPKQPHVPVLYLDHEDTSHLLAPSFDQFLEQWERLGYVAVGYLLDCRSPETGFLDSRTPAARILREKLGLEA